MNWKNCAWLVMLLLISFAISVFGWGTPLNIEVDEISFSGGSLDGITIKTNTGDTINPPEWDGGGQTCTNFAFTRSVSYGGPEVKVKFFSQQEDISSATIFVVPDGSWTMNSKDVTFVNQYAEVTYQTTSGVLPNFVGIIYADWAWRVSKVNGVTQEVSLYTDATNVKGYVVLSDPLPSGSQPRVGLLDKACAWAGGATSESAAASGIITGIYNNSTPVGKLTYDIGTYYGDDDSFDVTSFLEDMYDANIDSFFVNCTDCANLFRTCTLWLGFESQTKKLTQAETDGHLDTYPVDPIGEQYGSGNQHWIYHQFGWMNNLIYDGVLKLNQGGTTLPIGMQQGIYLGRFLDPQGQSFTESYPSPFTIY